MHVIKVNKKDPIIFDGRSRFLMRMRDFPWYLRFLPRSHWWRFLPEEYIKYRIVNPGIFPGTPDLEKYVQKFLSHNRRRIDIFTTNKCNLKCEYCYQRPNCDRKTDMTREIADAALDLLFKSKRKHFDINFFGGEPLLNLPIIEYVVKKVIKRCKKVGKTYYFTITTNGTRLSDEAIKLLVKHKFGVMVSLDGRKEDNVHRIGQTRYERLVKNIRNLLDAQRKARTKPLILRSTLTSENKDEREVISEYFEQTFPGARIGIGAAEPRLFGESNVLDIRDFSTKRYFNDIDTIHEAFQDVIDQKRIKYQHRRILEGLQDICRKIDIRTIFRVNPEDYIPNVCGVCRNNLAIGPEGDMYPCHRYYGMKAYFLGNILKGGFDSNRARDYYEKILQSRIDECSQCWAQSLCMGICVWRASQDDGTICRYSKVECDLIRKGFEHMLYAYVQITTKFKPEQIARVLKIRR